MKKTTFKYADVVKVVDEFYYNPKNAKIVGKIDEDYYTVEFGFGDGNHITKTYNIRHLTKVSNKNAKK